MNCSQCLELDFDGCSDFTFEIGLADGSYWAWLYDKFDNIYKKAITVSGNSFTLYQSDYPEGLFASDGFTLEISTSETTNTTEDFTYAYESYGCIVASLYYSVSGTSATASACHDNYTATTDPALTDDRTQGYCVGSEWLNTSTNTLFKCTDATANSAVWMIISFT